MTKPWLAIFPLLVACGQTQEDESTWTDGGVEAAIRDAAPEAASDAPAIIPGDAAFPLCPLDAVPACGPSSGPDAELLLSASDLSADRLVLLEPRYVLAERDVQSQRELVVAHVSTASDVKTAIFGPTDLVEPLALAANAQQAFLLLCASEQCQVQAVQVGSGVFSSWPAPPLSRSEIDGLVSFGDELCVFGAGLYCTQSGVWTSLIDTGPRLHAASAADELWLAGDQGRLVQVSAAGKPTEWNTSLTVALRAVVVLPEMNPLVPSGIIAVAAGEGGQVVFATAAGVTSCAVGAGTYSTASAHRTLSLVTDGGIALDFNPKRGWCTAQLQPSPLVARPHDCGWSHNLWWLTSDELWGRPHCPIP